MKQKKMVISVYDADGNVVFSKDNAVMEHIGASVMLYAEDCAKIVLDFVDVQCSNVK